jgi:hypothetical protein
MLLKAQKSIVWESIGSMPSHIAFYTPNGHPVLIASNPTTEDAHFTVASHDRLIVAGLKAYEAATYFW